MQEKVNDIQGSPDQQGNHLYPIFLKLDLLAVLVVGAGNVALEKLRSLLSNSPGACITVVAPFVRDEVRKLVLAFPKCKIIEREFEETDLDNKRIVICATDSHQLHQRIRLLTTQKGILINVADTPGLCDFYLGSIVQKGSLKFAVSTNGKSPTIAKRMKEMIADMIPSEMEEILDNLQTIRSGMKGDFHEKVKRLNEITKELVKHDNEE